MKGNKKGKTYENPFCKKGGVGECERMKGIENPLADRGMANREKCGKFGRNVVKKRFSRGKK